MSVIFYDENFSWNEIQFLTSNEENELLCVMNYLSFQVNSL